MGSSEKEAVRYDIEVPAAWSDSTVKSVVSRHLHPSRRMLRQLVSNGAISVQGEIAYLNNHVHGGDIINVMLPLEETEIHPESIDLDVRYEDHETLIVNKPPGMLTHPTARERGGSLLAAAYAHIYPRVPHCIHRLDRETSGVVMLAKHGHFHHLFDECLRRGEVHRVYCALVNLSKSRLEPSEEWETIDLPIAQDPHAPSRRIISASGQRAITHYRILDKAGTTGLAMVVLETGRTHQIRLHFSAIGLPLLGDKVYGQREAPDELSRQALHALGLWFIHPVTAVEHRVYAQVPEDIVRGWVDHGGDLHVFDEGLKNAFLETGIFANIEGREEWT